MGDIKARRMPLATTAYGVVLKGIAYWWK